MDGTPLDGKTWTLTQEDGSKLHVRKIPEGWLVATEPAAEYWGDNDSLIRPALRFTITGAQLFRARQGYGADCGDGIYVNRPDKVFEIGRKGNRTNGGGESLRVSWDEWHSLFPVTSPDGWIFHLPTARK